jgi:hypothetical protein
MSLPTKTLYQKGLSRKDFTLSANQGRIISLIAETWPSVNVGFPTASEALLVGQKWDKGILTAPHL